MRSLRNAAVVNIALFAFFTLPSSAQCTPESPTQITAPTAGELIDVAYGDGKYVAVGQDGALVWSQDGSNWAVLSSGGGTLPQTFFDVEFGAGEFVIVGEEHVVLTVDASDLIVSPPPTISPEFNSSSIYNGVNGVTLVGVAYSGNNWMAVGWRLETGGYTNYAMLRGCDGNNNCSWSKQINTPDFLWDDLSFSETFRGIASASRCDTNKNFVALRSNGNVIFGFNSGNFPYSLLDPANPASAFVDSDTDLSGANFVKFVDNGVIAGDSSDRISTSDSGGYVGPQGICAGTDPWADVRVDNIPPLTDRAWFGASERADF